MAILLSSFKRWETRRLLGQLVEAFIKIVTDEQWNGGGGIRTPVDVFITPYISLT
jgi:hypothetical protein